MKQLVWFFDLDNTLHDASHAIFQAIDTRMTAYVQRHLNVDHAHANQLRQTYWRRYGATMLGLIQHHNIDPHHFLRETHDFDVAALLRAERGLAQLFARLPGRKVLLTNAPAAYARTVLRELKIDVHMQQRYSIETMRVRGRFRPKPSRALLLHMLARERVARGHAVLVEDSLPNLKSARAAGFRTVFVHAAGSIASSTARAPHRPSYVDVRVNSVRALPRLVTRVTRLRGTNR